MKLMSLSCAIIEQEKPLNDQDLDHKGNLSHTKVNYIKR